MLVFELIYIAAYLKKGEEYKAIDTKEHKLHFLYPMAGMLITITKCEKRLNRKSKVLNSVKAINITGDPVVSQKLYFHSKVALVLMIMFLCNLLSVFASITGNENNNIISGNLIRRPDHGEGSRDVEVMVNIAPRHGDNEKDGAESNINENILIHVKEPEYRSEDLEKVFEEALNYLQEVYLGNNSSNMEVTQELNLVTAIPDMSIEIEWFCEDYILINKEGKVNNEEVGQEGIFTSVKAVLTHRDSQVDFIRTIKVMPIELSDKELLLNKLNVEIDKASDSSIKDEHITLPDKLEDYKLNWYETKDNPGLTLLIIGILLAVMLWFYKDIELEKNMEKRKNQLLIDYPEIINRFTLLVNAGMTLKQAWEKVTEDYLDKPLSTKKQKRYAYEEMLITVHELKLGVPEGLAYEQFGRRIGVLPYMKFASLITQNLKKGNRGLSELLNREALDAFEERKETAKRMGEEAGTKLLAPMMIMLIIVLIIILIPAFMSFNM